MKKSNTEENTVNQKKDMQKSKRAAQTQKKDVRSRKKTVKSLKEVIQSGQEVAPQQEEDMQPKTKSYTARQYKDRLFKFIFKDKEKLLSLYNALNASHYTNPDDIEITTLEDVIYCNMKNDVSFIIDDRLSLFEHQSTYNPNMPLRGFLYFAKHFEKYIAENEIDIYGKKLIELPTPKFVVFFNGSDMKEEKTVLHLSSSFVKAKEKACMELEAEVLNINYGKNKELMESCRPLMEYSYFVQRVKKYSENLERDEAIELAVDECIKENILKDILSKNRAEVVDMLLTEYDEEKRIRIMNRELEQERQRTEEAKQWAEEERKRAEAEKQRAEEEKQRAEEAKQRAEEYKKQIQQLQQHQQSLITKKYMI